MSLPAPPPITISPRQWLAALLLVSAAIRLWLAMEGGQFFFGDEGRYLGGLASYEALRTADWPSWATQLRRPEHVAFHHVCTLVAALQHGLAQLTPWADWSQAPNPYASIGLGAAVLSLFPVLNIWLVYRLARAAGASEGEATWAALLMAASHTLFYYSRHLVPYDCALSAALGGWLCALSGDSRRRWQSGALAALCYHLYNGYWFLVPVILLVAWLAPANGSPRWRAGAWWAAGFLLVGALVALPGALLAGASYWETMQGFSGTVTQGLYAEGWSLAAEYLWHSEGWLGVAVLIAMGYSIRHALRPGPDAVRLQRWCLMLFASWALPVVASVLLHQFVVYARTVRPLVPLACLLAGFAVHRWSGRKPQWRAPLAGLIVVAASAAFAPHFGRVFPREFELHVLGELGVTKHALSFTGSIYKPLLVSVQRPDLAVVNAQFLYPVRAYQGPPAGDVIVSLEHPLAFPAYQYEGHVPRERRLLREHPPHLQLIRLAQPEALPDHPPAADIFTDADRPDGRDRGRSQTAERK